MENFTQKLFKFCDKLKKSTFLQNIPKKSIFNFNLTKYLPLSSKIVQKAPPKIAFEFSSQAL
jgi:hypothetical protein